MTPALDSYIDLLTASNDSSGAPTLSITIEGPSSVFRDQAIHLLVKVIYEHPSSGQHTPGPITVHKYALSGHVGPREGFRLYRRREDKWEACETGPSDGDMSVDKPDVPIQVGRGDDHFVSLDSSQPWMFLHPLDKTAWSKAGAAKTGDVFRCRFNGTTVDWWDWGTREDHVHTVVWVAGAVTNPKDNGGRPQVVVPASNWVEFTLVD